MFRLLLFISRGSTTRNVLVLLSFQLHVAFVAAGVRMKDLQEHSTDIFMIERVLT